MTASRTLARTLAAQSISQGKPLKWFETLYQQAGGNESVIPWADMSVNPNLEAWLEREQPDGTGQRALVIGCGLGDDAEALASFGFYVTAFDISETCIDWCRRRFPLSPVEYSAVDLFMLPSSWRRAFDFVLESYTLQVLPVDLRPGAIQQIAECVASDGTLLVISRGRNEGDEPGKMPWPLVRDELVGFAQCGLIEVNFEDYLDAEVPPVRRFRARYHRSK